MIFGARIEFGSGKHGDYFILRRDGNNKNEVIEQLQREFPLGRVVRVWACKPEHLRQRERAQR